MRYLVIVMLLVLSLIGCTPSKQVIEVPIEVIKTEYVNKLYKDSIYIHDSIDRYVKGDTMYQYKYKYIYQYLTKVDTIVQIDSIDKPVRIVEVKEVNKLKWYQSSLIDIGLCSIILLLMYVIKRLKFK